LPKAFLLESSVINAIICSTAGLLCVPRNLETCVQRRHDYVSFQALVGLVYQTYVLYTHLYIVHAAAELFARQET
jgi:hypothetical protein